MRAGEADACSQGVALTNQVTRAPPTSALNLPASLCQRGVRPRLARCRRAPLHIHLPRPAVASLLSAARLAHRPYARSLLPVPVSHNLKIRVCVVELILAPLFPPPSCVLTPQRTQEELVVDVGVRSCW